MTSLGTLVEKLSAAELMFGLAEFEYRHWISIDLHYPKYTKQN